LEDVIRLWSLRKCDFSWVTLTTGMISTKSTLEEAELIYDHPREIEYFVSRMELLITRHTKLQDRRAWLNGVVEYVSEAGSVDELFRSIYRHYNINYPKFLKMDNLCKLAFLSAEILLQGTTLLEKYPGEEVGIVLENASSSQAHLCSSIPFQTSWSPRSPYDTR
jgi:hypothetical protein